MNSESKPEIPLDLGFEIGGPGRVYYDDVIADSVVESLMEIAALIWTVRDRQIVMEKVLAEKGIDVSSMIESHVPDDVEAAHRLEERDALVKQVFHSFLRRPSAAAAKDFNAPSKRELEDKP
ncbi:MAG: hypothetical protein AB8B57_11745 [Congregibacter sp.]